MSTDPDLGRLHQAQVCLSQGRYAEAAPIYEAVVERMRRERAEQSFAEDSASMEDEQDELDEAEDSGPDDDLPRIVLNLPKFDPRERFDRQFALTLKQLAICYMEQGKLDEALRLLEEGIQTTSDPFVQGMLLHEMAMIHQRRQDLDAAIQTCQQAIDREIEGKYEPVVALQTLGVLYQLTGRLEEARGVLELVRESCESRQDLEKLGPALRELGRAWLLGQSVNEAAGYFTEACWAEKRSGLRSGFERSGTCLAYCLGLDPSLNDHPAIQGLMGSPTSESQP